MINALVGHLVGDYLIQNDWMALNKKSSTLHCSVHCALWSLSVLLFTQWYWAWFPILFVGHFIQDRTSIVNRYMDFIGQKQFAKNLGPWSIIVVDNTFHIVFLWCVARYIEVVP